MSFKLSRSQFLQVFAVMQSIKLINGHYFQWCGSTYSVEQQQY